MRAILLYGFGVATYFYLSRQLKDKDSEISKCFKKYADKVLSVLHNCADNIDGCMKESCHSQKKEEKSQENDGPINLGFKPS